MAESALATNASGRCECGGVSYVVDGPLRSVWNCQCTDVTPEPNVVEFEYETASGGLPAD